MKYTAKKIDGDTYEISERKYVEGINGEQVEVQPLVMNVSRMNYEAILSDMQEQIAAMDLADNT